MELSTVQFVLVVVALIAAAAVTLLPKKLDTTYIPNKGFEKHSLAKKNLLRISCRKAGSIITLKHHTPQ
jgi:hypothetical protein